MSDEEALGTAMMIEHLRATASRRVADHYERAAVVRLLFERAQRHQAREMMWEALDPVTPAKDN